MIPLSTFGELFNYNYWARDRQLEACGRITQEQFLRPMGNSFSSLRDTLAHLLIAEWGWHERWRGRSPTQADIEQFSAERLPTAAAIQERWHRVERDIREYLMGLSEEALAYPLSYTNLKGERWSYPLWRMLFHVVNHQTYHRGQVTTLLRQLGAQPVQIDFLVAHDLGLQK